MTNTERTGKDAASAAGRVLASDTATAEEKTAAASALAQTGTDKVTSAEAASAAAETLASETATEDAKTAAASALTQYDDG